LFCELCGVGAAVLEFKPKLIVFVIQFA
jgi:hypothetical protein